MEEDKRWRVETPKIWVAGETNTVAARVPETTFVDFGDLVYYWDGLAFPAKDICNVIPFDEFDIMPHESLKIEDFIGSRFLGIAMQKSDVGESEPIRIATTGVFKFDHEIEGKHCLGDMVGPVFDDESRRIIENKKVSSTFSRHRIGVVAKPEDDPTNKVHVKIFSALMG